MFRPRTVPGLCPQYPQRDVARPGATVQQGVHVSILPARRPTARSSQLLGLLHEQHLDNRGSWPPGWSHKTQLHPQTLSRPVVGLPLWTLPGGCCSGQLGPVSGLSGCGFRCQGWQPAQCPRHVAQSSMLFAELDWGWHRVNSVSENPKTSGLLRDRATELAAPSATFTPCPPPLAWCTGPNQGWRSLAPRLGTARSGLG